MYVRFYNLTGPPFQLTPDHRFFFGSQTHQKALAYLTFGLLQGEGFIVITGDIGSGKTTLVGQLLSQLDTTKYVAATVVTTQLDADDTLRMVASAFGLRHDCTDKASLLREIESFLLMNQRQERRVLLLIDEAQNLPARSLEELRMLSNFQVGEKAALQIYLLGQPQFRQTLARESLEQLRQRIIASHHLGPMQQHETQAYIEHRLAHAGWKGDPQFTADAFERIFRQSGGVPRKINTLCTRLLLFGALEQRHTIDSGNVEEVIRDLLEETTPPAMPGTAPAPPSSAADPAGARAGGVDLSRLERRIDEIERSVERQERTLRLALRVLMAQIEADAEPTAASTRQRSNHESIS